MKKENFKADFKAKATIKATITSLCLHESLFS